MNYADTMAPTADLRYVKRGKEVVLQQWWSNREAVKMGPANMVKGEWRDVPLEEEDE